MPKSITISKKPAGWQHRLTFQHPLPIFLPEKKPPSGTYSQVAFRFDLILRLGVPRRPFLPQGYILLYELRPLLSPGTWPATAAGCRILLFSQLSHLCFPPSCSAVIHSRSWRLFEGGKPIFFSPPQTHSQAKIASNCDIYFLYLPQWVVLKAFVNRAGYVTLCLMVCNAHPGWEEEERFLLKQTLSWSRPRTPNSSIPYLRPRVVHFLKKLPPPLSLRHATYLISVTQQWPNSTFLMASPCCSSSHQAMHPLISYAWS